MLKAIQLKTQYNIPIRNLLLGRGVYESASLDPLCQAVEQAWKARIVVVVAAGNHSWSNSIGNNGYGTFTAPGADLFAAISLYDGPRDRAALEFHSDAIAVVRQPVTVNHFGTDRIFIQRSKPQVVARSPGVFREYTSAARTDVIGVRLLFSVGTHGRTVREAHYHDYRQPRFHSARELRV